MNLFDFGTAMNIVGNNGCVSRLGFCSNEFLKIDEDGILSVFAYDCEQEKENFIIEYTADVEDIKAQDWFLFNIEELDFRTEDEVDFDELVLELRETVSEMCELGNVSMKRADLFFDLQNALNKFDMKRSPKTEEVKYNLEDAFNDLFKALNEKGIK